CPCGDGPLARPAGRGRPVLHRQILRVGTRQSPRSAERLPSPGAPHRAPPIHLRAQSTFFAPCRSTATFQPASPRANLVPGRSPAPPDNRALETRPVAVPACASTVPETPTSPPDAAPFALHR